MRPCVAGPVHQRRDNRWLYQACPPGHWGHGAGATAHSDSAGLWLSLCGGGGGVACGPPSSGAPGAAASRAGHADAG
jgi:hypothetical protein